MSGISKSQFMAEFLPRLHADLPKEAQDFELPAIRSDDDLNGGLGQTFSPGKRAAAVLIGLAELEGELQVLLTQRSDALPTHPGQIAFPGGKVDAADAGPVAAAFRETHEEVGIAPEYIRDVGFLDVYQTRTGFRVVPVVAFLEDGYQLVPEPGEVTDIFYVPLAFFMREENHHRHVLEWQGEQRYFYAMPYGERYVWGATAGMLRNFYERVFSE